MCAGPRGDFSVSDESRRESADRTGDDTVGLRSVLFFLAALTVAACGGGGHAAGTGGHAGTGGGNAGTGGSGTGGSGGGPTCPPNPGLCSPSTQCVGGQRQTGGAS